MGASASIDDAILPYLIANDAKLVDGKVVGDPTEGALLVLAHKAGLDIDGTREKFPRLATLPFDPTYKLMAAFCKATDAAGKDVVRSSSRAPGRPWSQRSAGLVSGDTVTPWSDELAEKRRGRAAAARRRRGCA